MYDNQLLDQQGMSYITHIFSKKGCIINESGGRETGIDAICELRKGPYQSAGLFLAIQLKTGISYFSKSNKTHCYYYADDKHIDYWLKCSMPVLFVIHNPESEETLWTKIEKNNLIKTQNGCRINIPFANSLKELDELDMYEMFYGKIYREKESFENILKDLTNHKHYEADTVHVSGLELFVNGICNSGRQLYFNIDLYSNLMEYKINHTELRGFTWPHDFFEEYFCILNYHNLLSGTFEFELQEMNNHDMIPMFIKHLSSNGLSFYTFLMEYGFPMHDKLFVAASNFMPYLSQ